MEADELRRSRRRFSWGCAGGGLAALAAFFWMLTDGTGNLFQAGLNTNFYDVQARALLAGHWWVPAKVLSIEGIVEHGRTYMYYGPLPAVLRMPILLVTHSLDGRLTGLSMFVAFAVALVFLARLSWSIRLLVDSERAVSITESVVAGLLVVLLGAGSALFFLASNTIVYHEAELWGAALALGGFDFAVRFLRCPRIPTAIGAGALSTLAMLSRGSVGAGPVVTLALICGVAIVATVRKRFSAEHSPALGLVDRIAGLDEPIDGWPIVAVLAACVVVPLAAYAAVNEVKFGSLFSLPLNKQVETMISPHRRAVLAANGGSLFGLKFVPTALYAYLRPDAIAFTRLFPFVMFPKAATVLGHLRYDDRDWASSVTATMPLATLLALVGIVAMFRRRPAPAQRSRLLRLPILGAIAGTAGILEIAFIANRYLADMMPLVVIASLAGAHLLAKRVRTFRVGVRIAAFALVAIVAIWGAAVNTGLTVVYQRELRPAVPLSQRAGFVAFQESLDQSLFGDPPTDVVHRTSLLRHAPAGTLAIIGNCDGLYQSAGIMSGWDAVERSPAAGHVRLALRLPPSRGTTLAHPGPWWPVVANGKAGAASWLALRAVGHDSFQFGYLFEGTGEQFLVGSPFTGSSGSPHVVDAVVDAYVQEVTASVDGTVQFELGYFVRANRPLHLGENPFGGPVAGRFPGGVRSLPVTTPICDELERRLSRR